MTRRQLHEGVAFFVDEGETMMRNGLRQGSTLLQHLRTAWSGFALSTTNADADKRRHMVTGSYAFALCACFQPSCGTTFLRDAEGGTPQRFLMVSARDEQMPETVPTWPDGTSFTASHFLDLPKSITVHPEVERELDERLRGKHVGTVSVEALDAHSDLIRLRVAGLLAVADALEHGTGRVSVGLPEWSLARRIGENSQAVRRAVEEWAKLREAEELGERVKAKNTEEGLTDDARAARTLARIVDNLENAVHRYHDRRRRTTDSALWNALNERDRKRVTREAAFEALLRRGNVVPEPRGKGEREWVPKSSGNVRHVA